MSMREGESVKAYVERYRKMFNEIDGDFDEVAIRTFKVGLLSKHGEFGFNICLSLSWPISSYLIPFWLKLKIGRASCRERV